MDKRLYFPGLEFKLNEIQSNVDIIPTDVQLLRVGKFYLDGVSEPVQITPEFIDMLVGNFKKGVRGIDIAIDYNHESEKEAAGWVRQLYTMGDGEELWARVDWTPVAKKKIAMKEYRYLSADFRTNYADNETLVNYGPTLMGAGLTNRPVVKGMAPAYQLSESAIPKEDNEDDLDLVEGQDKQCMRDAINKLKGEGYKGDQLIAIALKKCGMSNQQSEDFAAALCEAFDMIEKPVYSETIKTAQGGTMAESTIQKPDASAERIASLEAEVAKLTTLLETEKKDREMLLSEKKNTEKRAAFDKLMTDGKVCEAQREAYMNGDVVKFSELSAVIKTQSAGTSATPPAAVETPKSRDEAWDEIIKLSEPRIKSGEFKNPGHAYSAILRERADLRKLLED